MNKRTGAVAGIVFLVLSFGSFALAPPPPAPDATTADWLEWYTDNPGGIQATAFLFGLTVLAILVWFGAVRAHVWRGSDAAPLAPIATVGIAVMCVGWLTAGGISSAVAQRVDELGADVVVFAAVLAGVMSAAAQFGLAALMGAVSAQAHARGTLPRWLVAAGGIGAVMAMTTGVGVASDGGFVMPLVYASWLVTTVWIAGTSVALWKGAAAESDAAAGDTNRAAADNRAPMVSAFGG